VQPRGRSGVTHDEGLVVIFKLRKSATGGVRSHGCADSPFVDGGGILLEEGRGDERLEDEPST
jgi:hypothetical protein